MPVEGQWKRANTPLSRADRRLLAVVAVVVAIAAAVAGIVVATRPSDASGRSCVVADVPSTMGGARLRSCGAAAHSFCRTQGPRDRSVAAACRRQGFAADLP